MDEVTPIQAIMGFLVKDGRLVFRCQYQLKGEENAHVVEINIYPQQASILLNQLVTSLQLLKANA